MVRSFITASLAFLFPAFLIAQTPWAFSLGQAHRSEITDIARGNDGSYYFCGNTYDSPFSILSYNAGDVFLGKISPSGNLIWLKTFPGNGRVFDIEFTPDFDLVMAGGFVDSLQFLNWLEGPETYSSAFLMKADTGGNVLWAISDTSTQNRFIVQVNASKAGHLYTCGLYSDVTSYLAHYTTSSTLVWSKEIPSRTLSGIQLGNSGEIFLSGTTEPFAVFDSVTLPGSNQGYLNFLGKWTETSGSAVADWIRTQDYITFDFNQGLVLSGGNLYWLCGALSGIQLEQTVFEYSASGNQQNSWMAPFAGFFPQSEYLNQFRMVHPGEFALSVKSPGRTDILRLNAGIWDTLYSYSGNGIYPTALYAEGNDYLLAGGFYDSLLTFPGASPILNQNNLSLFENDQFLYHLGQIPLRRDGGVISPEIQGFRLGGNGSGKNEWMIMNDTGLPFQAQLLDLNGRSLSFQMEASAENSWKLTSESLNRGMYFLRIENAKSSALFRLIAE